MLGKTPEGITAFRPMKEGIVADYSAITHMIRGYLEDIDAIAFFSRPSVIVSIPYGSTEVARRAVEDAVFEAGAKSVALVDEPIAAALGSRVKVSSPKGKMIVDVGGGTTEVAVISLSGVVTSRTLRVAGDTMDNAIIDYLESHRRFLIGQSTAEALKIKFGSAHPSVSKGDVDVFGRNLLSGMGAQIRVTSDEIREALSEPAEKIIRGIASTLEKTPPELSSDISDFGIILTGGGAMLSGLGTLLQERLGISVRTPERPLESVCNGILRIIESEGELGGLLRYRNR
jgi:rod shape-determining protein MreB